MRECIFCKIIAGEIPSAKIYEDSNFYAFLDIGPVHKGHALVIPKTHVENILEIDEESGKNYMSIISKVARGVVAATEADGCNIVSNIGAAAGQQVFHAHVHIIPRFEGDGLRHWPKDDTYNEGEMDDFADKIKKQIV